jgi:hypothetical protein
MMASMRINRPLMALMDQEQQVREEFHPGKFDIARSIIG